MEKKQMVGLIGTGLLAIGVFTPVMTVFGLVSVSLSNSTSDLIIILALAAISGLLVLKKVYKGLWFTGLASLGWLAFRFFQLQSELSSSPNLGSGSSASASLSREMSGMVSISWGWLVLGIGAVLDVIRNNF